MDHICPQPPEQLQERMQAMAAAIKQEEAAQVDALHRQRALEKRLQEISKVRDPLLRRAHPVTFIQYYLLKCFPQQWARDGLTVSKPALALLREGSSGNKGRRGG